ncbi:substrate-binding domain-containing protein [Paraglaciecola sp.]|uniref:substrate-binding domain-containing protein n=1 Tax=Paraglaciecola sp. TaxID=1920173 RepID=UPI0030F3ABB9
MRKLFIPWVCNLMLVCQLAGASTIKEEDFVTLLAQANKSSQVVISDEQATRLTGKHLTAALAWHGASPWINAVNRGASETFERYGVKVLVTTDAQYDPAKQVADIENIQALNPDLVLSLVIDSVSAKAGFQKIVDAGAKLVLLSNPITGFVHGKDFAGIVTDDMQGMGNRAAQISNEFLHGNGKVGMIYHDANYFITNTRDKAFVDGLAQFPKIEIQSRQGFVKEHDTSAIASAMMLRHPDLDLIYVSWDAAAEGVVESLRSDGFNKVKVISHDLGVNNLLDMAQQGNMLASISDRPYEIGATMARVALLAKLGVSTPMFTLVPYDQVNKSNITEVWQQAYHTDVPRIIKIALGE